MCGCVGVCVGVFGVCICVCRTASLEAVRHSVCACDVRAASALNLECVCL